MQRSGGAAYPRAVNRRSWTLLLALSAIWGASYLFIKIGLRDLSPAMVAWGRTVLAAAVLVAVAAHRAELRVPRAAVAPLVLVGTFHIAGPFLLIAEGEQEISSALAGILVAATPLFTALLAIRFDPEERSQGARLGGILLGLVGVAVLLGLDLGGSGSELLGAGAVLLACLGYAIAALLAKRRFGGIPPVTTAAWVMVAGAAILLAPALATAPEAAPALGPLAAVLALGVVGTGVAFAIFYDLIARVGPARTYIVTYLSPAFAVVYGVLLLGEAVSLATLAGLALILGGSYLAAGGPAARRSAGAAR